MHLHRRVLIVLTVVTALLGVPVAAAAQAGTSTAQAQPLALVYRGPASVPGTAESVATVLRNSPSRFRVEYVGPKDTPITAATLARATVFAQPGGPSLSTAWKAMKPFAGLIRDWIAKGGNYLGFCVGGYLAGATPGYDLLPGDTSQYSAKQGATVWDTAPHRSEVVWRGTAYTTYFQDPPAFDLEPGNTATVLGTYRGGEIAALAVDYGSGRVGVTGPHVEADRSWFVDDGLSADGAVNPQLAYDLIETTVRGNRSGTVPAVPAAAPTTTAVPAVTPAPAPVAPPAPTTTTAPSAPTGTVAAPVAPNTGAAPGPAVPPATTPVPPIATAVPPTTTPAPRPARVQLPWPFDRLAELPLMQQFIGAAGPGPALRPTS
ncbi:BPL-N domain-containing protein [Rhodococcus olei]|uniref:BPL-N domain-containing protein n=1 Tax=Rhodococcus olei TaxID=2161675 RepID=UPI0031E86889